jgi:hypothetical protein
MVSAGFHLEGLSRVGVSSTCMNKSVLARVFHMLDACRHSYEVGVAALLEVGV